MTYELIGYQLKVTQQTLRNRMDRELMVFQLTTPQYAVLCGAERFPGLSNADLARYCFVSPQTVNEIVKTLESRTLVNIEAHKSNKKKITVLLTPEGRKILQLAHKSVAGIEECMLSDFSLAERKEFLAYLKKCVVSLGMNPEGSGLTRGKNEKRK